LLEILLISATPDLTFLHAMADALPPRRLILASSSRYRRELLERLRVPFEVVVPGSDETPLAGEMPAQTAERLAQTKARDVARNAPDALIIGSDQVATIDGLQLGKPGNHAAALLQLQTMRGRTVEFHSALCLFDARTGIARSTDVITRVRFRSLPDAELQAYLHAEQPYDVAGSAKSEGLGIALLEAVHSDDPTALVGLPLIALTGMLIEAGYPLFAPS
jgi:septum formation protein